MCVCVCVTAPARGERGEGGRGAKAGDSPNPLEEAKLHRRTLGLIYGFTQRDPPPPPPRWPFCGVGVSGEGIKRWGIEGIRIGTSDRFGRGRGEFFSIPSKWRRKDNFSRLLQRRR